MPRSDDSDTNPSGSVLYVAELSAVDDYIEYQSYEADDTIKM